MKRFEVARVNGYGWVVFMDGKGMDCYGHGRNAREIAQAYANYMNSRA